MENGRTEGVPIVNVRPTKEEPPKKKQHAATRHQANLHRSVLSLDSTVFFFWRNNYPKVTSSLNRAHRRTSSETPQALAVSRKARATSACSLD